MSDTSIVKISLEKYLLNLYNFITFIKIFVSKNIRHTLKKIRHFFSDKHSPDKVSRVISLFPLFFPSYLRVDYKLLTKVLTKVKV